MNKKGFTLIEIIAVITILGIIALITVPVVNNSLKNAKEKMLEEQKTRIVDAAKEYALDSNRILNITSDRDFNQLITLNQLKGANYLEQKDIINPVTDDIMKGCIFVKFTVANNRFAYAYSDRCAFGNYYPNGVDFYFNYLKESTKELTLGGIATDLGGVTIDSKFNNEKISVYNDAQGLLFDKDGKVVTLYKGVMMKAENLDAIFELYKIYSDNPDLYFEGNIIGDFDIYIDPENTSALFVVDIIRTFGLDLADLQDSQTTISEIDTIEETCQYYYSGEANCEETVVDKHLHLDN